MTLKNYGAVGKNAEVILVWVRAPCVGNAPHAQKLEVTIVRRRAMRSLWCANSRMPKNISI